MLQHLAAAACGVAIACAAAGAPTAARAQPLAPLCSPGAGLNLDAYVGFYQLVLHPGYVADEDGVEPGSQNPPAIPVTLMRYGPNDGSGELVLTLFGTELSLSLFDSDGTAWSYAETFDAGGRWPAFLTVPEVVAMTGCEPLDLAHMLAGDATWFHDGWRYDVALRLLPGQSGALYGHGYGFGYPGDNPGKVYRGAYYVELVPMGR